MPVCSVIGCGIRKTSNQPSLTIHRIPKNELKKKKWLEAIGMGNIRPNVKRIYICSLHFDDKCFNKTLDVIRLRDDAMPFKFVRNVHASGVMKKCVPGVVKPCVPGSLKTGDNADFKPCEVSNFVVEDLPPESSKGFSWQQPEATVDLAEEDVVKEAAEYQQDDLSLYCSDDEDRKPVLDINEDPNEHAGFHCNVCNTVILGFRYVCVQCSDFDLCGGCEAQGTHDQHYVLRIPGPRPYSEVQRVLAQIREHLTVVMDPKQVDEDTISIKPEVKEEYEESPLAEADPRRLQHETEAGNGEENQKMSQDGVESSQEEKDPLLCHNSSDTDTVDESESEWTPSKSNLDNIKTFHRHEDLPGHSSKYIPPMKTTPIIDYIKVVPIRNITEAKPKMIQSNIEGKADPLPVQKPNLKLVLNRASGESSTAKMTEDIKGRRFIVDKRDFKKFLKMNPPVKRLSSLVGSENTVKVARGIGLPASVTRVFASGPKNIDKDTNSYV